MKVCIALITAVILFYNCSPNNVNVDNSLKKHFDSAGVHGTFAILDNGTNQFTIYNLARYKDSSFLPASTFKIINSLIGLQTGKIINDSMTIQWDGIDRGRSECNGNLTMYEAFRISCPPWYQELSRRIGTDTMQTWLDSLEYGNKTISTIDTFWLDNSLKISPDEQLGLMKKLYFDQLPFHKINQDIVKRAMLFEDNTNYRLSYKTGWGNDEEGKNQAWIVGWLEENKHPYFFVLNIETAEKNVNIPEVRMKLLKNILTDLDFLKGKR
jgi:beta-lactamase class D